MSPVNTAASATSFDAQRAIRDLRTLADVNGAGPWADQWAAADTTIHVLDALLVEDVDDELSTVGHATFLGKPKE